jgi:hypothetical protein
MPALVISLPGTLFIKGEPCFLGKSALRGARAPLLRDNVFTGYFAIVKVALWKNRGFRVVIVDSTDCVTVNWFRPVHQDLVADSRFRSESGLAEVKEIAQSVLSPVFIQEGVHDVFGM